MVVLFLLAAGARTAAAQRVTVADLKTQVDALTEQVQGMSAQSATNAQAAKELAEKVAVLTQELDRISREQKSIPDAVSRLDELAVKVAAAEQALAELRTRLASVEQPAVAAGASETGGSVTRTGPGFLLKTADGASTMNIRGFVQPQFRLRVPSDFDTTTESSFLIRRARLRFRGQLRSPDTRYNALFELTGQFGAPLFDFWVEHRIIPELSVRVGQDRVPFSRSALTSSLLLAFPERAFAEDHLRYDRDIGVWLRGSVLDKRIAYMGGVSNGAGRNKLNDNIDGVFVARVQGAPLGEPIALGEGDLQVSDEPRLTLGAAGVHDLVRLPDTVAGVEVGNGDVDGDGVLDNVRVMSVTADATFRYQGAELYLAWLYRHERWGSILDHTDNEALAEAIRPNAKGRRNYQAFIAHGLYTVVPSRVVVGARFSRSRIPLLGVSGRSVSAPPLTDRLFEYSGVVQLYNDDGLRWLGLQYRLLNFNGDGPDPDGDIEHRVELATQLVF